MQLGMPAPSTGCVSPSLGDCNVPALQKERRRRREAVAVMLGEGCRELRAEV
jgi:hypothetical protein